jgi:hypothetical protein
MVSMVFFSHSEAYIIPLLPLKIPFSDILSDSSVSKSAARTLTAAKRNRTGKIFNMRLICHHLTHILSDFEK